MPLLREGDPFDFTEHAESHQHDWLAYEVDEVYDSDDLLTGLPQRQPSEEDESAAMEEDNYRWP